MIEEIQARINAINEALPWLKKNRPNVYESLFIKLVEERRKLGKLVEAERDNPAIAAYGVSQTGKSYLMSNVLQKNGQPFMAHENGRDYNFIEEMNPLTTNTEATGVVTRFSSFSRNPERYSEEHPFLMKTFSLADVILVICEGYYKDLDDYRVIENIPAISEGLYNQYKGAPEQPLSVLKPEDILEMKNYLSKHINNAQSFSNSDFFDRLALVINRIPVTEYCRIFSTLWNNEPNLTAIFNRLFALLQRLMFSKDIYLPAEALLHHGKNENTILSVDCLNGLNDETNKLSTNVFLREGGRFTVISDVRKSELCALCREVVFHIDEDFIDSNSEYDFSGIGSDTSSRITHGSVQKSLMRSTDLLDFPGARPRDKQKTDTLQENKILCYVLLRGKVAYLFNKYNEAHWLNILLYCHDYTQNNVPDLFITIDEWVNNYVGRTPEDRSNKIALCGGISPLFYVATKFNVDMALDPISTKNEETAVAGRWNDRFGKVLLRQCFNAEGVKWVKNWTSTGSFFQNCYLLRDFKYSGEKASKLYSGFAETRKENSMTISPDFYNLLRSTFCQNDQVRKLFNDPAMAWDVAASINNDGALYIIEKLTIVAKHILDARNKQFHDQMLESSHRVYDLMHEFYVDNDIDKMLQENIRKARAVQFNMDVVCSADKYYFGHFIQTIQINEPDIKDEIHRLIQGSELNEKANNSPSEYEIIRDRCGKKLDACKNDDERWQVLMNEYGFRTREDCEKSFANHDVDITKLFKGDFRKRVNSVIIADHIFDMWCKRLDSSTTLGMLTDNHNFDPSVMVALLENIKNKSKLFNIQDRMAETIQEFTNMLNASNINESLVADILSGIISDYVINLGFGWLSNDQMNTIRRIKEQNQLDILENVGQEPKAQYGPEQLTAIFDSSVNDPNMLTLSFGNNYRSWIEYMFISFVSNVEQLPDYDKDANDLLDIILKKICGEE